MNDQTRDVPSVPIAPSMATAVTAASLRPLAPTFAIPTNERLVLISVLAMVLGLIAAFISRMLTTLIAAVTNLAFYSQLSFDPRGPAGHHLGAWVVLVPVLGGVVVGLMARYGSAAIRGHGIPEAMEQVLRNESRIPVRVTFLKPLSAAVSIGTGGPFGAEGPIIATGGALGSLVGQIIHVSADERKTLLAAGAAAGMSATFGSPVSAVLLAIELLLFEYRARSIVPVALASAAACAARILMLGDASAFALTHVASPGGSALLIYVLLGAFVGLASVLVTRSVYAVEDLFEKLPRIHWMWWPALGGLAVGLVGVAAPHTMGVGYDNIDRILAGDLAGGAALGFCFLKFVSWSISLGSGTSGGTLAPLFTIGGGLGSAAGALASYAFPAAGIDVRVAALVGMAAMFAGASRALLTSILFAFETTRQAAVLLPLLGGCTLAFLVSKLLMQNTIMTEKLVRRGTRVIADYDADSLHQRSVKDIVMHPVAVLAADHSLPDARSWLLSDAAGAQHRSFPVVDKSGHIVGVLTRREVLDPTATASAVRDLITRPPIFVFDDISLREATDLMFAKSVSRLPIVSRDVPFRVVGMVGLRDLSAAVTSKAVPLRARA